MSRVEPIAEAQKEYIENGKNKYIVKCKYCPSKILEKRTAKFATLEKELPLVQQENKENGTIVYEIINEFYHVDSMYTFENIGFSHTVANCKYLSCADCDIGPVGFYNMDTKQSYVAISRIVHVM